MGFKIDDKDFQRFTEKFGEMNFNQFLKDFLLEQAERLIAKVKPRTPVDTGDLRRHWDISNIYGSGKDIYVEIINNMEYATEVEYGHRGKYVPALGVTLFTDRFWTEGRFMLKISTEEVRRQMPLRYEQSFAKFCNEMGIS